MRALAAVALLVAASSGVSAQASPPDTLSQQLPVPRLLGAPPAVLDAGTFRAVDGAPKSLALTSALGVTDLRLYRGQLTSLFPTSVAAYPADSIRGLESGRAREWHQRLTTTRDAGVIGRQRLDLAEVATNLGDDSTARRLIDARLAELPAGRPGALQRSLALGAMVTLLTNTSHDSARIAHNLPAAEEYATRLSGIPATGYTTKSDSTNVLYRQYGARVQLIDAAEAINDYARLRTHADHALGFLKRMALMERRQTLSDAFPFRDVAIATAASGKPGAVDSLQARLLALGIAGPTDVDPNEPQQRAQALENWRRRMRDHFASFALLGKPAAPVMAHAWLNMPDSAYSATPRSHRFDDGMVRVFIFGDDQVLNLPALERVRVRFPERVQVVMATATRGHIGPDIATPQAEVAYMASYFIGKRGLGFPIAVWAGEKVPGNYNSLRPRPSPNFDPYVANALRGATVLIDGKGTVRGYQQLDNRLDEERLARRVRALLAEPVTP